MLNELIELLRKHGELRQAGILKIDVQFKEIQVDLSTIKQFKDLWVSVDHGSTYDPYLVNSDSGGVKIYACVDRVVLQYHFPELAKEVLGDV